MSRCMGPTKAMLVVIALIWTILVSESTTVSSVVEELAVEECKHHCKHEINKKECEEDPFCEAFCKPFEGLYQHCMSVCPRTKSIPEIMAIGGDGVANGDLQTKCNRKCPSYTGSEAHKRCMSGCYMSNEQVCETSCSILQEEPLTIRCMRVCHETIPGADTRGISKE